MVHLRPQLVGPVFMWCPLVGFSSVDWAPHRMEQSQENILGHARFLDLYPHRSSLVFALVIALRRHAKRCVRMGHGAGVDVALWGVARLSRWAWMDRASVATGGDHQLWNGTSLLALSNQTDKGARPLSPKHWRRF